MNARVLIVAATAALSLVTAPLSQAAEGEPPAPNRQQAAILLGALQQADAQGLPEDAARLGEIEEGLRSSNAQDQARAEGLVTTMALAYARIQHGGRLSPGQFRKTWAIRPLPYDVQADFQAAMAKDDLASWIASLPPPDPRYSRLVAAYARYRDLAAKGGWPILAMKGPVNAAAKPADVRALRARLAVEDPLLPARPAERAGVYDQILSDAVSRAQARHGLNVDGVAGPSTIAALNIPIGRRLAQIRANLERWRWMPRGLPAERVELNIPAAWFEDFENGAPVLSMRAVVGRPSDPTPSFLDHIHAVLFYPPWNVPAKIAAKELWPKERRSPGYLAREGFRRTPDGRLQQQPGPKNALGLVKFELDDPFAVYFHDTPARSLFARENRALSHGCMRLEQPYALAKRLLRDVPDWPEARIEVALKAGVTQRVWLPERVMAYVVYWTAFVGDEGQVNFRPDVYGWDDQLLALLPADAARV